MVAGCLALTAAILVLLGGWVAGIDAFKSLLPGSSTMKANTAIAIGSLGASLAVTPAHGRYRPVAQALASVAVVIGLVTLAEYAFHWDAGGDQLWFWDVATPAAAAPGRPAAATAVMMVLLGAALLCAGRPALARQKTLAAAIASMISWATLNGYLFGPEALHAVPAFGSIALHTAVLMLLVGFGVLAVDPVSLPLRMAFTASTGGVVCRWLLPPAILAPPMFGWLLSRDGVLDFFPPLFDWAVNSSIATLGSVWLIMVLAHRITVIDAERYVATELSRHDPLTGLANRRTFDAFLHESFNLSRRHDHALSLLLLDVDRFKSYNDSFGHPAGDEVLREVGVLLLALARKTDLVARVGGEEFAIILPETDAAGARVLAERARAELEHSPRFRRQVTASVGVSTLTRAMGTPRELIEDCDLALYRAKGSGRNLVLSNGECSSSAGAGPRPGERAPPAARSAADASV